MSSGQKIKYTICGLLILNLYEIFPVWRFLISLRFITTPSVTIGGESVPLIGTMVMTMMRKNYVSTLTGDDGKNDVYNVNHLIEFRLGNYKQELPAHYTQVAEPETP